MAGKANWRMSKTAAAFGADPIINPRAKLTRASREDRCLLERRASLSSRVLPLRLRWSPQLERRRQPAAANTRMRPRR